MRAFACLRHLWNRFGQKQRPFSKTLRTRLSVEGLESRLVPYAVSGNLWPHPELVTISLMPDGTNLGGGTSNLQSTFDNHPNAAFRTGWRKEVLRAAQSWAQQTNLNFALVADNGAASGSGLYQQGDPGFGDIRIGGMNLGGTTLGSAYLPPPANNYSIASDFILGTTQTFNLNATFDLFTVAAHEFGHGLGLLHTTNAGATPVMYSAYNGIKSSLRTDDISGIRNIYSANLARLADSYDVVASNGTFATATDLTALVNPVDKTALVTDRDITTTADLDYYKVTAPSGTSGSLTVKVQSTGLSLLSPLVKVYNSAQVQIGSATGLNQYGATLTVTVSGVTAGQQYYVMVDGADNTAFGTGKYALTLNFGTGPSPTVPLPLTLTANGNPLSGGGGQPNSIDFEARLNSQTANQQKTADESPQAVAMDAAGNFVAVWASEVQDGSGWGIYGQRFNAAGAARGVEFRVNTTTDADQEDPAVAMDDAGNFVVAWASYSQDANGWGVYAQRYDSAGVAQGSEFRVNTAQAGQQQQPSVAMDRVGNFVITWQDSAADGGGWGILGQRYNAAGAPQGGEFRVNTVMAGDQTEPSVAMDAAGNFVVAWTSNGQDGSGMGVFARGFNAAGVAPLGEFLVNVVTTDYQEGPAVAMDDAGRGVIVWSSKNQDGDGWGGYARRFSFTGMLAGAEFRVNNVTAGDQRDPAVAMDSTGGFTVTWSSMGQDGGGWGVYARQYNSAGAALAAEFRVNTTTAGDQENSSVALDNYGHVAIVWSGNGAGDADGVFTQRYAITGGAGNGDNFSTVPHEHEGACSDGCTCPACQAAAAAAAPATKLAAASPPVADTSTAAPASKQAPASSPTRGANKATAARDALFAELLVD